MGRASGAYAGVKEICGAGPGTAGGTTACRGSKWRIGFGRWRNQFGVEWGSAFGDRPIRLNIQRSRPKREEEEVEGDWNLLPVVLVMHRRLR